jgi:predicted alpha/beta hydrolase
VSRLTAQPQGGVISLKTEDDLLISATFYPAGGDLAVVFARMGIADQSSWTTFAEETAAQGISTLTFDFRCFGLSECRGTNTALSNRPDVLATFGS